MAETPENNENPPVAPDEDASSVPIEEEQFEDAAPRRAASAEFVVESEVGSQALLREAMDPANQSLREALRLSFRVLQVVILVLVVLFFFSGFQTVKDGQSGVMLRWGKILGEPGRQALNPGLKFSKWPYPVGEFVLFSARDRRIDIRDVFWPDLGGQPFETAVENANVNTQPRIGRDGSLLTADGDLAHMQLTVDYAIDTPVAYLRAVENARGETGGLDADRLVTLMMQRAAVHAAARLSVEQIVELSDEETFELARGAQTSLDRLLDGRGAGIRIVNVDLPVAPSPPLAIRQAQDQLQAKRQNAQEVIERAREEADAMLFLAAGEKYQPLLDLIEEYEDALDLGETERAETVLVAVNARLEGPEVSGDVADIINFAKSYSSTIESTLGTEARIFASLLPQYRQHPEAFVSRQWAAAYKAVLTRADAERFYVPANVGGIHLTLAGYDQIRQTRREKMLDREEQASIGRSMGAVTPFADRMRDLERKRQGQPGRQLGATGRSFAEDR